MNIVSTSNTQVLHNQECNRSTHSTHINIAKKTTYRKKINLTKKNQGYQEKYSLAINMAYMCALNNQQATHGVSIFKEAKYASFQAP